MSPAALLARPRGTPSAPHPRRCAARSEEVRPRTIITRSLDEIARFHEPQSGKIVLKPLTGYGGQDVYLVNENAHRRQPDRRGDDHAGRNDPGLLPGDQGFEVGGQPEHHQAGHGDPAGRRHPPRGDAGQADS
jgi:hypothetical protein